MARRLTFYRRWMLTLPQMMIPGGKLIVECGDNAADSVMDILSGVFSEIIITKDLNGMERVVDGVWL